MRLWRLVSLTVIALASTESVGVAAVTSTTSVGLGTNIGPHAVDLAPNGDVWIAGYISRELIRVNANLAVDRWPLADSPDNVVAAADGSAWATTDGDHLVHLRPGGATTYYSTPTAHSRPYGIATAPNGDIWFTEYDANRLGVLTPATSTFVEYRLPTATHPWGVTIGRDGTPWATTTSGQLIHEASGTITETSLQPTGALHGIKTLDSGQLAVVADDGIGTFDPVTSQWSPGPHAVPNADGLAAVGANYWLAGAGSIAFLSEDRTALGSYRLGSSATESPTYVAANATVTWAVRYDTDTATQLAYRPDPPPPGPTPQPAPGESMLTTASSPSIEHRDPFLVEVARAHASTTLRTTGIFTEARLAVIRVADKKTIETWPINPPGGITTFAWRCSATGRLRARVYAGSAVYTTESFVVPPCNRRYGASAAGHQHQMTTASHLRASFYDAWRSGGSYRVCDESLCRTATANGNSGRSTVTLALHPKLGIHHLRWYVGHQRVATWQLRVVKPAPYVPLPPPTPSTPPPGNHWSRGTAESYLRTHEGYDTASCSGEGSATTHSYERFSCEGYHWYDSLHCTGDRDEGTLVALGAGRADWAIHRSRIPSRVVGFGCPTSG